MDDQHRAQQALETTRWLREHAPKLRVTIDPDPWRPGALVLVADAEALMPDDNHVQFWVLHPVADNPGMWEHIPSGTGPQALGEALTSIALCYMPIQSVILVDHDLTPEQVDELVGAWREPSSPAASARCGNARGDGATCDLDAGHDGSHMCLDLDHGSAGE